MHIGDFDFYCEFFRRTTGLSLSPEKTAMLDARLTPVARKWRYPSLAAMTLSLRGMSDPALVEEVIEAVASGETSFFRDEKPFTFLRETGLPWLLARRKPKKPLRFWSAAAGTGQEAWSVAMILRDMAPKLAGRKVEILATDISKTVLETAQAGAYSQFEVQRGLPVQVLMRHFVQHTDRWAVHDDLRAMVAFDQFNLLHDMKKFGTFDAIFCRNVLGTFDEKVKNDIVKKLAGQLADDGFLFLGADESADDDSFVPYEPVPGLCLRKGVRYDFEKSGKAVA